MELSTCDIAIDLAVTASEREDDSDITVDDVVRGVDDVDDEQKTTESPTTVCRCRRQRI